MREQLIGALSGITSSEQLTEWAYRQLPIKNTLAADDAIAVEEAFRAKVKTAAGIDRKPLTGTLCRRIMAGITE